MVRLLQPMVGESNAETHAAGAAFPFSDRANPVPSESDLATHQSTTASPNAHTARFGMTIATLPLVQPLLEGCQQDHFLSRGEHEAHGCTCRMIAQQVLQTYNRCALREPPWKLGRTRCRIVFAGS